MTNEQNNNLPSVPQNFTVVGLGASAGGLEAFKRFIPAIRKDSGMAYVLVQHLNPSYESQLPELLSQVTQIPVHPIEDEINLVPNNIYVIPENKVLTTFDGKLKLESRKDYQGKYLPIDIFFHSLGEVHLNYAVGIVLSGTGSDGTLGLKAIKKFGGITFAQETES